MFGIVKFFPCKGQPFGMITKEDGVDIYVHYKGILSEGQENPKYRVLTPGQKVEFDEAPGYHNPGTQAINVKIVLETQ